jgi:hypothetical protein
MVFVDSLQAFAAMQKAILWTLRHFPCKWLRKPAFAGLWPWCPEDYFLTGLDETA